MHADEFLLERPTPCSAAAASLGADKASLEQQLQGVLAAERELTAHLRETHAAIEGQLTALRDQLQVGCCRWGRGEREDTGLRCQGVKDVLIPVYGGHLSWQGERCVRTEV